MDIIKEALEQVTKSYVNLLKTHYPAISDNALPEANQTYYFCNALVDILNKNKENEIKAAASLEVPISVDGKSKKVDGVVVSPSTSQIFYIEAKRLKAGNEVTRKLIFDDIIKVKDRDRDRDKDKLTDKLGSNFEEFIVILADLWLDPPTKIESFKKSKSRNEIPFWWCGIENHKCLNDTFSDIEQLKDKTENFFINNERIKDLNWSNKDNYIIRFKKEDKLENYCLLVGSTKLKKKKEEISPC